MKNSVGENFNMIAKTQLGLEEILADELLKLGAQDVQVLNRAVSFVGDVGFMYKANLNQEQPFEFSNLFTNSQLVEMLIYMKKPKS